MNENNFEIGDLVYPHPVTNDCVGWIRGRGEYNENGKSDYYWVIEWANGGVSEYSTPAVKSFRQGYLKLYERI